jgi:predicted dehydrogenase
MLSELKVGVVGAPRGRSFMNSCKAFPEVRVAAVCDMNAEALGKAKAAIGEVETYTDFDQMVTRDLDIIVIATPQFLHAPQAVRAMQEGKHVLSEVPAATDLDQCRALADAVRRSGRVYMMAENYCYMKPNVLVRAMAQKGLFGETYYGEGAYIHELKELNEVTRWRRKWQTGINGNTYPTHSLGPVLQWMQDRVVAVSCAGSGHHYRDPRGVEYGQEDCIITLCRLSRGGLVEIRLDMLSDRPHNMTYYSLQGNKGCYEAPRGLGDQPKVWLADYHDQKKREWHSLWDFEAEFMPEIWRNPPDAAKRAGHGGGDFFEVWDFLRAIKEGVPPPVDIQAAMDFTVPGLVSQQSILQGGAWLPVPDFRTA